MILTYRYYRHIYDLAGTCLDSYHKLYFIQYNMLYLIYNIVIQAASDVTFNLILFYSSNCIYCLHVRIGLIFHNAYCIISLPKSYASFCMSAFGYVRIRFISFIFEFSSSYPLLSSLYRPVFLIIY